MLLTKHLAFITQLTDFYNYFFPKYTILQPAKNFTLYFLFNFIYFYSIFLLKYSQLTILLQFQVYSIVNQEKQRDHQKGISLSSTNQLIIYQYFQTILFVFLLVTRKSVFVLHLCSIIKPKFLLSHHRQYQHPGSSHS